MSEEEWKMKIFEKCVGATLAKHDNSFYVVMKGQVYELNETGARIFDLCDGCKPSVEIAEKLAKYYSKDIGTVKRDVDECLRLLEEKKLITLT